MPRLLISPAARRDLFDIGEYIALDDPSRAASFIAEIEAVIAGIAEQPARYPSRADLAAGLRSARHGRYLVFFLEAGEEIRIVRVLHGARDLPGLLPPG